MIRRGYLEVSDYVIPTLDGDSRLVEWPDDTFVVLQQGLHPFFYCSDARHRNDCGDPVALPRWTERNTIWSLPN
jgi:hypothetical protein